MMSVRVVVYAGDRPFRTECDALLRRTGVLVRMASRQAELAKAIGDGTVSVIIAGDAPHDAEVARATAIAYAHADASATMPPVMQRAPGESIGEIVARALAVSGTYTDQPRSIE